MPNIGECWNRGTATFMILGNVCTRRCGFCAVQKGAPLEVDYDEPRRVAEAVAMMGLRYAVITSVNRDDRKDGGAELFVLTIEAIRSRIPDCKIEGAGAGFPGETRSHGDGHARAARSVKSQYRNGAASLPAGSSGARGMNGRSICWLTPKSCRPKLP